MVKIHPYESCYYNELVGGIAGASKNFEIEYYGEVYKQGTIWLNQHAEISAVIAVPRLNEQLVRPYLRSDLKIAGVGEGGIERISNGLNGIVYYRMDEGGGSNVLDSSNNGNDGTIYNASWTTESKEGYALSFDGQDDYVEVPNSASLNTTTAITIVAWVKLNALDNSVERQRQGIVSKYSAEEGKRAYELYFDDTVFTTTQNRFVFAISSTKAPFTGGVIYSDITPSVGQWYCVVGRFKADEFMQIWINGEDHTGGFAYGSLPWGIATNDLNLYISKQYDTQGYFNGVIDEVRIYDRALTACEIQQLYQRGSPEPNYFMFMTRQAFYTQAQYYCLNNLKPSHKIEVDGVPILFIYKLRN